ncbi:hypothetical protein GQR58_029194 [Nymphon striatum]|nr:hypothetical protein GQR58_029194 [Nymphon striatum]
MSDDADRLVQHCRLRSRRRQGHQRIAVGQVRRFRRACYWNPFRHANLPVTLNIMTTAVIGSMSERSSATGNPRSEYRPGTERSAARLARVALASVVLAEQVQVAASGNGDSFELGEGASVAGGQQRSGFGRPIDLIVGNDSALVADDQVAAVGQHGDTRGIGQVTQIYLTQRSRQSLANRQGFVDVAYGRRVMLGCSFGVDGGAEKFCSGAQCRDWSHADVSASLVNDVPIGDSDLAVIAKERRAEASQRPAQAKLAIDLAREHIDIVGLGEAVGDSVHGDVVERASGGDDRPAIGPGQDVGWRSFDLAGGIRQWHDDRSVGRHEQGFDDRFGEQSWLARYAHQHRRTASGNHLVETHGVVGPRQTIGGVRHIEMVGQQVVAPIVDETVFIDQVELVKRGLDASIDECRHQHAGDPCARGTSTNDAEHLVLDGTPGALHRRPNRSECDGRGAFDVIVEAQDPIPVVMHQAGGILLREVLPLEQYARKSLTKGVDERFDERVVVVAGNPLVAPAQVFRIVESVLIVRPDIEHDRKRASGVDASKGGVQRQLAVGDRNPTHPLVAQTQDAFAVGNHHNVDIVIHAGQLRFDSSHGCDRRERGPAIVDRSG